MQALLISLGSMGDTLPFMALGHALQSRGHRVVLMANGYYREQIEREGLEFVEGLSAADFTAYAEAQKNWTFRQSLEMTGNLMLGQIPRVFEFVARRQVPGETVVVAQAYALGARIAQEKLGTPLATVHLQPLWMRSVHNPVTLPGWFPRLAVQVFDRLMDAAVDAGLGKKVNAIRAEHGLPPVKRLMKHWWNSPNLVLAMFPDWFDPPQPDWPPHSVTTGFPLLHWKSQPELAPEVRAFLDAGDPPLVFTQTAITKTVEPYFQISREVTQSLGSRAIFLTPHPSLIPRDLPETIRYFPFVPLDALLPRAHLHVHHGGIGTIAQSLFANVPQLTVAMANDQMDNSLRLRRLGCSGYLKPSEYQPARVRQEIERLFTSPEVRARCDQLAERVRTSDAMQVACDAIERLHVRSLKDSHSRSNP